MVKGNTYFNLILFAGGALAVDDKIICLQELCGRDPTFLPLQAKALGGNPSYVLLAFFVFVFFLYLSYMCSSTHVKEQQAGEDFKRILDLVKRRISFD